jgi:hypothetical protein
MISTISTLIAAALTGLGIYLPSPHDKDGWGLRVHNFSVRGPYIAEPIDYVRFNVTLINFSKETRGHDPLKVAARTDSLQLRIIKPDGRDLWQWHGSRYRPRGPFAQNKLRAGEFCSQDFPFAQFGYHLTLGEPGRYRLEATLKIDGKTITSPPVELEVVAVTDDVVLANQLVPLEGPAAMLPPEEQEWPVIQQVKVGSRTLLLYRGYGGTKFGGKVRWTYRLAELPGKVEMKVEGAFGDRKPLTITYKDANSPTGTTKLVINSIDGMPWTEEEERLLQERLNPKKDAIPAPRPVKP